MISKNQIKIVQSLHLKKNREELGLFIIEGIKLVNEFVTDTTFEITEVFATTEYLDNHAALLNQKKIVHHQITSDELKKISLLSNPNQVLAIVKGIKKVLDTNALKSSSVLYLDDIRDPGNFGTIIRIADWFGIKQIICSENTTELFNSKVLQASMGAVLRVNVVYMSFNQLLPHIKELPVYGAVLNGSNIYQTALEKGVIVIGNESNGISADVLQHISKPITIPSSGTNGSESLNAANACAIICGEFYRQLNEL